MKNTVVLVLAFFGAAVIADDTLVEPCADLNFTCVSGYFDVAVAAVEQSVTVSKTSGGVPTCPVRTVTLSAKNVVIEYPSFNTTVYRPEMKVAGVNKAKITKFVIDNKTSSAYLTIQFPLVTISGDNQTYAFHKTGQFDVEVSEGLKYNTQFRDIYTTTKYNMKNKKVVYQSAETNSQAMKIPKLSTATSLAEAGKKYSWIQEIIDSSQKQPDVLTREYIKPVGDVLYRLYMSKNGIK